MDKCNVLGACIKDNIIRHPADQRAVSIEDWFHERSSFQVYLGIFLKEYRSALLSSKILFQSFCNLWKIIFIIFLANDQP